MPKTIFRRAVTESSTTESNLGAVGELREETDGRVYRLVQAGASVADGGIVQLDSVSASTGAIVEGAHNSLFPLYGVNIAGQSVAAAGYFFALVRGTATVRSADIDSDVSINSMAPCMFNTDVALAAAITATATTLLQKEVYAQFIESVSRDSDAAATGIFYIWGMGA